MPAPLVLAALLALPLAPQEPAPPKPPADAFRPEAGWKALGPGLWFDPKGRRLVLRARVVLRDGALEHLLCLVNSKEHESILATEAPPRLIVAGLLLTGAKKGHPVVFQPEFRPPTGTPIRITVEWEQGGKTKRADARTWVLDPDKKKTLDHDWVFAGSMFFDDPITKKETFAADYGDLFTVSNFTGAILDVPFRSSASDADRTFVANTEQLPPKGTPVTLYLRPAGPRGGD